jgi:hypothetical protein
MHKTKDAEIDKPRVAFICVHNAYSGEIDQSIRGQNVRLLRSETVH